MTSLNEKKEKQKLFSVLSKTSEDEIVRRTLKLLKRRYPQAWVYRTADKWKSGVPDLIVLNDNQIFAFEIKTGEGTVDPIQEHTLSLIRRAGGIAEVCRSAKEVLFFMGRKSCRFNG